MKITAIIVAGGKGKRMGKPKQLMKIAGRPMLEWAISAFKKIKEISEIIVVTDPRNFRKLKGVKLAKGGRERQDSVRSGLRLVSDDTDLVLIHDGARPLTAASIIKNAIREAKKCGAVVAAVPVKDTVKQVNLMNGNIMRTLHRDTLWLAQTPQVFKYSLIKRAYRKAKRKFTDDAQLVEALGHPVRVVMGSYENIKITTPEDLIVAGAILKSPPTSFGLRRTRRKKK